MPLGIANFAHSSMKGINTRRRVLKNILIIVVIASCSVGAQFKSNGPHW
jgi:hypothetical protein